ncbi:hypothetical protein H6G13_22770 [Pseudanabaena sp. FACHB-2040]|nr:hypothetical protein [Pseudanabaena sp. FACHB-2040]
MEVQAVPVPPPPTLPVETRAETELKEELNRQKELTAELKSQLERQQTLTEDLRVQLSRQQDDTDAILDQLSDYRHSMETMAAQQTRLAESIPQSGDTQTVLLWGIAGLFLFLIVGGGAVLTVFAVWLLQSQQRQSRRTAVVYPMHVPNHYPSYEYQALPAPSRPQRVVQYDVQDFAD